MPDIKVTRVEVKKSEQYGNKKILHVEDGSKWNVRDNKAFYDDVSGPGIYSVEFKEYQGKQYISYLRFKSALNGQNQATSPVQSAGGTSMAGSSYDANMKLRLNADKKRQDDIRLEFYCGVAKDILIANKKDKEVVNHNEVIAIGLDLYKKHLDALEMLQEQEAGKNQVTAPDAAESAFAKAQRALKEAEEADDTPF